MERGVIGAVEYARYLLACPRCKATGVAKWWEADGWSYLRHPDWDLDASAGFERVPGPKFDGPRSFYDRSLVCKACGVDAETTEISGAQFFSIERPVAGSHHEPSAIDAKMGGSDLMRSKLGTIRADAERMCDSERFNHVTVRTVRRGGGMRKKFGERGAGPHGALHFSG